MNMDAKNGTIYQSRYVRCVKNKRFLFFRDEPIRDQEIGALRLGRVYKVLPPAENDGPDELRVIDESGEDYLYPASYFEPLELSRSSQVNKAVTAHVPEWLYGILYAEAVAADKPVSTLIREYLEDHLDLPQPA